jgi:Tol biopolymer transport system component
MFMRDAVINDVVPPLERLGGYTQYRVGQTMYWYIADKYGPEKVGELLNRIRTTRSPELGFKTTFGFGISDFGDKFQEALKKKYFPDLAKYEDPTSFAEIIADHKKLGNFFNSSPVISPDGKFVAYISDHNGSFEVHVKNISNPGDDRTILSGGGSTAAFEELHLLTPGLTWTPDGKKILIASKAGKFDAISTIDVQSENIEQLPVPNLDAISELSSSPNGKYLALIGYKNGASDVYLYEYASKNFTNLTRDVFSDKDLAWSSDSKSLYFSSDRQSHLTPGEFPVDGIEQAKYIYNEWHGWDIFKLSLDPQTITRITATPDVDEQRPTIAGERNKLFYISDANGIDNIYASDLDGKNARAVTNSVSRMEQITVDKDASKLVFCAVNKLGYNLYVFRNPLDHKIDSIPLTSLSLSKNLIQVTSDSLLAHHGELDNTKIDTVAGYGSVGIDLSNYVYSDNPRVDRSRPQYRQRKPADPITGFKDTTSGHYISHDYKVLFSSDIILGTAGYTGYYGLQGSAQMLFSDELGNHNLYFVTNLILDLKNSDYLLAYYNLTDRTNYGLQAYHSARFLYTSPEAGFEQQSNYFISRFTSYGLTGIASYPFDRFKRIDLGVALMVLEKDVIADDFGNNINLPTKRKFAISPSLSYVLDNTTWSYFYPANGTRYNLTLSVAPGFGKSFIGFVTPQFDVRNYEPLFGGISIATRIAGAASFGPNPQRFYLGGVDLWINRYFSNQTYPLNEPEDFAFYGSAAPLRGYAYNEKVGTKYLLANIALRFPFPVFVAGLPLGLFAEAFTDAGTAWNKSVYFFEKKEDGSIITRDLLLSTGVGLRTYFFGLYLKLDIAWRTNLQSWSRPDYIFSMGQDF